MHEIAIIDEPQSATALMDERRRRILEIARTPASAVEIAEQLEEPRQRVGYHVRQLADAGLLDDVGESRRGAMIDRRYRTSAACYALAPTLLGSLAARLESSADHESLAHLLGAVNEVQSDLTTVLAERGADERVPTLTLSTKVRFPDERERGAFADALMAALTDVVARWTSPYERDDDDPPEGDAFRLTLTLHPTRP